MSSKIIKLFLRLALATSFLSAVADRFGFWSRANSVWGNWDSFLNYTKLITPWLPNSMLPLFAITATVLEVVLALCLLVGFKTELSAKLSALLLLAFALSMSFSAGIKGALDFSVFTASAAAFSISLIKVKYLELDNLI